MENLNEEQVKKALECCKTPLASDCANCSYTGKRLEDGVYEGCVNCLVGDALALINELTVELEAMRGAANSYKMHNEKLTDDVESWKEIAEGYQKQFEDCAEDRARLTEENERLKADNENKCKDCAGCISDKCDCANIEAYTVEKYKSAIIEYYSKPKYQPTKEHPIKHTQIEYLFAVLDQIAKKLLEGENEAQEEATSDQYTQSCDYCDKTPEMLRQRVADIKRDMQKGMNAQNLHDYIIYRPLFALYGEEITGNLYVADEHIREINKGEAKPNDENSIHNQKEEGR